MPWDRVGSAGRRLIVTLGGWWLLGSLPLAAQNAAPSAPEGRTASVVVLPFANITGESGDEWIGAGIAEALVTNLEGQVFTVIGPERVVDVLGTLPGDELATEPHQALEVGRRVGADWLISGAYQRLGDRIRITGRFVEVVTGTVVRSAKVDGALDQLFALQDRVLAELLSGSVSEASGRGGTVAGPSPGPSSVQVPATAAAVPARAAPRAARSVTSLPAEANPGASVRGVALHGPSPPVPPAVVSRDNEGGVTLRAIRIDGPLTVDGRLDDEIYQLVPPASDFIQQVPNEGEPATEKTEAWVFFDDETLYVAARSWDSQPERMVANEMRRDNNLIWRNASFTVVLDTFYDRRNGYAFMTNPLGALRDLIFTNEGNLNSDWNTVWDTRAARFRDGWTTEIAIPFKSLRYRGAGPQVWSINLRRIVRRKNEHSFLSAVPVAYGLLGMYKVSSAATLVGLETPAQSLNLEVKPYAISGANTDRTVAVPMLNDVSADAGFDVKYGLTRSLTADFTYNTDFAQVEDDDQQINLTRFNLFFPEKREFFLEGRGIFDFARGGGRFSGGGTPGTVLGARDTPTLFYSRRIGLEVGQVVPIIAGGRVTGKVGPFDVGGLNIQTDDEAVSGAVKTNFTVVRVKRDIFRRSSIGGLVTNRSVSLAGDGSNQTYGVDATLSFYDNLHFLSYFARTVTPQLDGQDTSYQGRFTYSGDRYGMQLDHLLVEDHFNPEIGFLRRDNFRRSFVSGRFSPRPRSIERVRQFTFDGSLNYILVADTNVLETRQSLVGFQTEFENSDRFGISVADSYELLEESFEPGPGVTIPTGSYAFRDVLVSYAAGEQRRVVGTVSVRAGGYFSGNIRSIAFARGRVEVTPQLSVEPSFSVNWVDLPEGSFRTDLVRGRVNYTFTPRLFFSGLVQYNSSNTTLGANLRLRWEYSPGSELFVVYTEEQDTDPLMPNRFSELRNRGFVVKFNRLFRF